MQVSFYSQIYIPLDNTLKSITSNTTIISFRRIILIDVYYIIHIYIYLYIYVDF